MLILDLPDGVLVHKSGPRSERFHSHRVKKPFNSYFILALSLDVDFPLVLLADVVMLILLELSHLLLRDLNGVLLPQNLEPMHVHQSLGNWVQNLGCLRSHVGQVRLIKV